MYKFLRGLSLGDTFSRRSSKSSLLSVCDSVLGVLGGLISFPIFGGFQGFSSLFSPIAFIPSVVSRILKVFQEDILLSGMSLTISFFGSSGV